MSRQEVKETLARADQLFADLEYPQVVSITEKLVADARIDIDDRLDAYWLLGAALAVLNEPAGSERAFRILMRGRPSFVLPAKVSPKIAAVLRKVQMEELAIVSQLQALRLKRIIEQMSLSGEFPPESQGGMPLVFQLKVRDPTSSVAGVKLYYRRTGQSAFSALALEADETGTWAGGLPGEWTANPSGFTFNYYISTLDLDGRELLGRGSAAEPLALQVTPGEAGVVTPFYKTAWFWGLISGAVATLGVTSYLLYEKAHELPATSGSTNLE